MRHAFGGLVPLIAMMEADADLAPIDRSHDTRLSLPSEKLNLSHN